MFSITLNASLPIYLGVQCSLDATLILFNCKIIAQSISLIMYRLINNIKPKWFQEYHTHERSN